MKSAFPPVTKPSSEAAGHTTLCKCLQKNQERKQLSEIDAAYCPKCKERRRQFKTLSLWSLPRVLIIHLKRFGRDNFNGPLEKIRCPVDIPLELDLGEYMCHSVAKRSGAAFELYGVVNHSGGTAGGHYTAHARVTTTSDGGSATGDWFEFNDSKVSEATAADLDQEGAYILFY